MIGIADSVTVGIRCTVAAANAQGIDLVAVAVTISCRNIGTTALEGRSDAVAYPAPVNRADAIIHIIADAIPVRILCAGSVADAEGIALTDAAIDIVADPVSVGVGRAGSTADAEGVGLVAFTVAVSLGNSRAPAWEDRARSVAVSAGIVLPDAIILRVADAVTVIVGRASPTTDAQRVQLVSIAIAIA